MASTETGKRKAATLLMNLDTATASKLLKGLRSEQIQEVAIEMAQISASESRDKKKDAKIFQEFCGSLQKGERGELNIGNFLSEILLNVLGEEKAKEVQAQVKKVVEVEKKDIFGPIHLAKTDELVLALQGEHPQVAAIMLSEFEPEKVRTMLALFEKDFCCKVVWKMAHPAQLTTKIKQQMVSIVTERLESFEGETVMVEKPETVLREIAIVLSDVERGLRSQILDEIQSHDEQTATMIRHLMITWEDVLSIADRSLQEALHTVDANKLAIALYEADEQIARKIRSNISERAAEAIDEEVSLMQEPLAKEILDAREEILKPLRKANEEGALRRAKQ